LLALSGASQHTIRVCPYRHLLAAWYQFLLQLDINVLPNKMQFLILSDNKKKIKGQIKKMKKGPST